ncbi:MAG: hypothetical protein B7733_01155 [Myxococcales bacterium FL481]|nr:MAG: hypothetical protein B7733_01155 [Myxococcales bacterium FL481]
MPLPSHHSLELTRSYRSQSSAASDDPGLIGRLLRDASEALAMALLTLDSDGADESRHEKHSRAAKARSLLAEAVTALSRAKVYLPKIHTYAVPAVMASVRGVDRELSRLHQLASTLTMRNCDLLPGRRADTPLSPADEAQLRQVLEELRLQSKLGRVARYRWLGFAVCLAALTPAFGGATAALALICAAGAVWQLSRARQPALTAGR